MTRDVPVEERSAELAGSGQGPNRVEVTAPASTANLGSGFDTLGMALALHDTVEITRSGRETGSARVSVSGPGAGEVPTDERHLVVRVLHRTLEGLGLAPLAVDVRCTNAIPHARGLGSSAAAIVAGVTAAYRFAGLDVHVEGTAERALQEAASVEGHADNVAASLFGGLAVAFSAENRYEAVRLEPHEELAPVVFVPRSESETHAMRGLLPANVAHADAAFAASRSALAVHALTARPDLLHVATEDRIHQDYREPAMPATLELVRRLRNTGVPAAVSGAGPTVLALPPSGEPPREVHPEGFEVTRLSVDRSGVRVREFT
ncbi:homoserine kinase [Actinopolyspora saharensis]|uniref:Homoserine kinase n=1 Tax=Actinopolyspora saharensis TaxID=995062 RepID=A0A1H1DWT0_9ACTN|nr:homoserine kinase [Actinopolyspora saharensis]SDQ80944.1 homoserine kinase [Actinopolyspora saharensis]